MHSYSVLSVLLSTLVASSAALPASQPCSDVAYPAQPPPVLPSGVPPMPADDDEGWKECVKPAPPPVKVVQVAPVQAAPVQAAPVQTIVVQPVTAAAPRPVAVAAAGAAAAPGGSASSSGDITIKNNNANQNANNNAVTASNSASSSSTTASGSRAGGRAGAIAALVKGLINKRDIEIENTNANQNSNNNFLTADNSASTVAGSNDGEGDDSFGLLEIIRNLILRRDIDIEDTNANQNTNTNTLDADNFASTIAVPSDDATTDDSTTDDAGGDADNESAETLARLMEISAMLSRRDIDIENKNANQNIQDNTLNAVNDAIAGPSEVAFGFGGNDGEESGSENSLALLDLILSLLSRR